MYIARKRDQSLVILVKMRRGNEVSRSAIYYIEQLQFGLFKYFLSTFQVL